METCTCCKREVPSEDMRYFKPEIFQGYPFCLPCYCSIMQKAEARITSQEARARL